MIAVDTNILVRLLSKDDKQQYAVAYSIFAAQEIFIPDTVILETEWVLRHAYEFTVEEITGAFRRVFGLPNVHINQAQVLALVIGWYEQGLDFADAFHLASAQNMESLKTFDQRFVKRAVGLSSCPVELASLALAST